MWKLMGISLFDGWTKMNEKIFIQISNDIQNKCLNNFCFYFWEFNFGSDAKILFEFKINFIFNKTLITDKLQTKR